MQAKSNIAQQRFDPTTAEQQPIESGSENHKDNVLEMPARTSEDQLLRDSLGIMMQCLAEDREARRQDRELNLALIAKLTNGNGASKTKTIIQTVVAVVGIVLIIGAYVVSISSDKTVQQMKVQTLEEKAAKAEKLENDVRKLEKLYMVRFGTDPANDNPEQPPVKRRR